MTNINSFGTPGVQDILDIICSLTGKQKQHNRTLFIGFI